MSDLTDKGKDELERLKLIAEVTELQHKHETEAKYKIIEILKSSLTIIISLTTIITAGLTIGSTISSYLKQKSQSEKMTVDANLLKMVDKLYSTEMEAREYAVLLLSSYGINAAPILLKNLEWSTSPERLIPILKKIQKKDPTPFNDLLLNAATEIFQLERLNLRLEGSKDTATTTKAKTAVLNYLWALEELGGDKEKIRSLLLDLRKYVENAPNPGIEEIAKDSILSRIERAEGGIKNK